MTAIDFAGNTSKERAPPGHTFDQELSESGILGAMRLDPIATLHSLIKGVSDIHNHLTSLRPTKPCFQDSRIILKTTRILESTRGIEHEGTPAIARRRDPMVIYVFDDRSSIGVTRGKMN